MFGNNGIIILAVLESLGKWMELGCTTKQLRRVHDVPEERTRIGSYSMAWHAFRSEQWTLAQFYFSTMRDASGQHCNDPLTMSRRYRKMERPPRTPVWHDSSLSTLSTQTLSVSES